MSTPQTNPVTPESPAPVREDLQARSFSVYDEKNKQLREKIKEKRVVYIVQDLPIY